MDFGIENLLGLYKRVTPALNSKVRELRKNNIDYIKKEDIWNFLIKRKWSNVCGLTLFDVVSDILNASNKEIEEYKKELIKNIETEAYVGSVDTL